MLSPATSHSLAYAERCSLTHVATCKLLLRLTLPWPVQAAILTGRRNKDATSLKEVDDSVDRIVAGMEGTPMVDSKSKSLVAYHEARPALDSRTC